MPLFIAVNFDNEVKKQFLEIQEKLREQSVRGNFSRPENLHLTLIFLGETPPERLGSLFSIMDGIDAPPFEISFNRTGCFTHSQKELWWVGLEPGCPGLSQLEEIHAQLLENLSAAGFSFDKRPFNAHVTLGREVKCISPITLNCPKIVAQVSRVSLMKSEHLQHLTYTEIKGKILKKH